MKTKAIIFDKDGTLIDFDAFWVSISKEAVDKILNEIDANNIDADEILKALGIHDGVTHINGVLCYGTYEEMAEVIYNVLKEHGVKIELSKVTKITIDAYHESIGVGEIKPICEGLSKTLEELKCKGIKLAVVTSDDYFGAKKCLDGLGITKYFDKICANDGIHPPKPNPYYIEEMCKEYNLYKEEIVMVGDTLTDTSFAKNGGIKVIGVAKNESNQNILKEVADCVIPDVSYIFDVIE